MIVKPYFSVDKNMHPIIFIVNNANGCHLRFPMKRMPIITATAMRVNPHCPIQKSSECTVKPDHVSCAEKAIQHKQFRFTNAPRNVKPCDSTREKARIAESVKAIRDQKRSSNASTSAEQFQEFNHSLTFARRAACRTLIISWHRLGCKPRLIIICFQFASWQPLPAGRNKSQFTWCASSCGIVSSRNSSGYCESNSRLYFVCLRSQ